MNLSKIKGLTQKANILKNYSSLLVPVVIATVGILLFLPAQLLSRSLKKQIEDGSVAIGKKIKSLSSGAVVRDQWKVEQEYQKAFSEDANQISLLMKHCSERPLLSYKIFPEPKETSTLIFNQFGQRYREGIDSWLVKLDAHDCPTELEIANSLSKGALTGGSGGSVQASRLSEVDDTIIDALCKARARSSKVYANAANIAGYSFWENYEYVGMEKAVQDCWFWQLGYWIIEDVLDTIDVCNANSASVFESPVKRLLSIDFATKASGNSKKLDARPIYITSSKNVMVLPCTARLSNSDIDVVHFEFSVIVQAKEAMRFMKELCNSKKHEFRGFSNELPEPQLYKHNQITILGADISAINPSASAHKLYRYGDAVVKLSLMCEYIFEKSGYNAIEPASVKQEGAGGQQTN
jgi:hypothetical protein